MLIFYYLSSCFLRTKKIAAVPERRTRRMIIAIEAEPVWIAPLFVGFVGESGVALSEVAGLAVVGATVEPVASSEGLGTVVVGATVVAGTVVSGTVVSGTVVSGTVVSGT